MTVNALAVVIQYLKTQAGTIGTAQIASKSHFAETGGWAAETAGIVVRWEGGNPDIYIPVSNPRMEVRIYAGDPDENTSMYAALVGVMRSTAREIVSLPGAGVDAMLYYLLEDSGPSLLFDEELGRDYLLLFLRAKVFETEVA